MDTGDIVELSRDLRRRSLDLVEQSQRAMTRSRDVSSVAMEVRLRSADACARSGALVGGLKIDTCPQVRDGTRSASDGPEFVVRVSGDEPEVTG